MPDRPLKLIEQAVRARRENRLLDAHRDFVEAIALCRQGGLQGSLLQALKGLAQIERDLGRSDAARLLYEEAVGICRDEPDALRLAHTVRHLGDVHQDAGRLDLAEPCYKEALGLFRRHEHTAPLDLANTIRAIAKLKEKTREVEVAVAMWEEARDLYTSVHVEAGVAECSAHLAQLRR